MFWGINSEEKNIKVFHKIHGGYSFPLLWTNSMQEGNLIIRENLFIILIYKTGKTTYEEGVAKC